MYTLYVDKDEVLSDFSFVNEWLKSATDTFIKKEIDDSKLEFYYSYGYFLPKIKNEDKEEFYMRMYDAASKMLFEERFYFELSKIRVSLTMKVGHFVVSNRLPKFEVPTLIKDIVREITKVKMLVEAENHDNQDIIDSIPEVDKSIVSFEIIREVVMDDYNENSELDFNLDIILDKISSKGLDSLSDDEKEFLDKKSKDI